jgi:uncharacterized repeat protein (TIGR01451 family)
VLSASANDNKIAYYLNNGSGSFGTEQIISNNAAGAASVYATDLDNDGDNDVVSASATDSKIAWYENNGSGSFSAEQILSTNAFSTTSVYATDLDGDNDKDIVATAPGVDKIVWYENNGSGNFAAEQVISATAISPSSVYATDLDGDGDNDVLWASYSDNKIAWYRNNGSGTFSTQQIITTGVSGAISTYAIDLDNDGDNDVLAAAQIVDKITWYENNGSGSFGAEQLITTAAFYATSVFAADIDGDGDNDVLSSSEFDNEVAWYRNLLALHITASANTQPCIGASNGSILIQSSGLINAPYSYQWTLNGSFNTGNGNGITTDNFTIDNLLAGTYQITVTNANGSTATATASLNPVLGSFFEIIDVATTNTSNNLPNGAIQVSVDGGIAPYTFVWSGTNSGTITVNTPTYNIPNLAAGNYNVTITDGNGYSVTHAVSLLDETLPQNTCNTPLDIVILNDVSTSVDEVEYTQSKQFFVNLINALNIGSGATQSRAAVIEWSDYGQQQIRIPITGNVPTLQAYSNYTRAFEGGTNPNDALNYGHTYLEGVARPIATKVLILSTDATPDQISGSLIAVAESYKAQGYVIISIAFDDAYSNPITRDILTQVASVPLLAPGADAYIQLSNNLANNIANLYVCPADPGSSNNYYFNRDGALDIVSYTLNGTCPNPQSVTLTCTVTADQQLSLPAGTPITFYYNNPAMFSATPIVTTYISCAVAAGTSSTFSVTLPVTTAANIWGVLNDNGTQSPPISFPITNITETLYNNNIDNITVCAAAAATLSALKYTTTPTPICGNLVSYTIDVCNISNVNATNVSVTDQAPNGAVLVSSSANLNNCASGNTTYNIPANCCVSITLWYNVAGVDDNLYNNQGVLLSGAANQTYINYDGSASSAEDVLIDGTIDCPSNVVTFTKTPNATNLCEQSFVSYTFTINNQTNTNLQNLLFNDVLPTNIIWAAEPYLLNNLSIAQTNITNSNIANFTIAQIPANTTATFVLDAYLGDWANNATLPNTATLSNMPSFVNGNGSNLVATAQTVNVSILPVVDAVNFASITACQSANLSAVIAGGNSPVWQTSGSGIIANPNSANTTYTPSSADVAQGYVIFSIAAQNACGQDIDTVRVNIAPPPICNDNNCATLDSLNANTCTCMYIAIPPPSCNDNNCTTTDTYNATTCQCEHTPINPPVCNDNNCGTTDTYNTTTCTCQYTPITPPNCDDGLCSTTDTYNTATCTCEHTPIAPPNCDDNNCGTTDSYNTATCACEHVPIPPLNCDDGLCGTVDTYNTATCQCEYTPIPPPNCNDNDCNTADVYNFATCQCEYNPISPTACDDGLCSTADSYNALTCACEHTPITPPNCDDNDCGTTDNYNTSTCSCEYTPIAPPNCDDNDCGTIDAYNAVICQCEYTPIPPPNCDDNDCNTTDSYNAVTCACEYTPIAPPNCDDNDCGTIDAYNAVICQCEYTPIPPPNCDDNDCNTTDSYNTATCTCEYTPIAPPNCDDNDCGTIDAYNAATCNANTHPYRHPIAMTMIVTPPTATTLPLAPANTRLLPRLIAMIIIAALLTVTMPAIASANTLPYLR